MPLLLRICLAALAASAVASVFAQEVDLDGKWNASFSAPGAAGRALAVLVIRGNEGTWRAVFASGRDNPCLGRETPISIHRSELDVEIKILMSRVQSFCQDGRIAAKLENGSLKGKFGDGRPVEIVRD